MIKNKILYFLNIKNILSFPIDFYFTKIIKQFSKIVIKNYFTKLFFKNKYQIDPKILNIENI